MKDSPFSRYAEFTDLSALEEYSSKPLRKCIRVNTLMTSVEEFQEYAKSKGWQLDPVLWCSEGFWVEREGSGLGKDLWHLLGRFYIQEAASMLPVALLDPEPGETILDMSAAPGSKTTQIAGRTQGRGVIIGNDIEAKRIKTLKEAVYRSGVNNVVFTKKVGQWFSKHMTERFDRVLCDAPCTAQGTARKDPDALNFCSAHSIAKNAALQKQLLEAAIHATKVGGRIVYSTCTLTPEENEEVILSVLQKFEGAVEIENGKLKMENDSWNLDIARDDSQKIVDRSDDNYPLSIINSQFRLWPQTYDTEGFFCAVLRKTERTKEPTPDLETKRFREEPLSKGKRKEIAKFLASRYGTDFIHEDERLLRLGDEVYICNDDAFSFQSTVTPYAIGMPLGRVLRDSPLYVDHEIAVLRGSEATENVWDLQEGQLQELLSGKNIVCDASIEGHILLRHEGMCIGRGRARKGIVKNHLPRWMIRVST